MANKLMYFSYDYTQNYFFCRLKSVVITFEHSTYLTNQSKFTKVPKVVNSTTKKKSERGQWAVYYAGLQSL